MSHDFNLLLDDILRDIDNLGWDIEHGNLIEGELIAEIDKLYNKYEEIKEDVK